MPAASRDRHLAGAADLAGARRPPARRFRRGTVPVAVLALSALLAGPANAHPAPSANDVAKGRQRVRAESARIGRVGAALAQATGRLDDLNDAAELAVERFNGERVKLEQAEAAYQAAQGAYERARGRAEQTRDEVATFAAGAYRDGGVLTSIAGVLGGPGGTTGFLERATLTQVLENRRQDLMRQAAAARTVAEVFQGEARDAFAAQRAATAATAAARDAAVAAVARQQAAVKQIRDRRARLFVALHRAQAHVAALRRARAAARRRAAGAGGSGGVDAGALGDGLRRLARGSSNLGAVAASAALKWLGTPYSWGGGSPAGPTLGIAQGSHTVGFDCSGLATYAWARAGVRLAHYATSQYYAGPHPSRDELRPGDLVFFAHDPSDPNTIHHVGIYVGNGQMVEAPFTGARVRISPAFRPDYAGATRPSG